MPTFDRQALGAGDRTGQDKYDAAATPSTTEPAAIELGGLGRDFTPEAAAELLRHRPDQRDAVIVIARLHQTMGSAFVRRVIAVLTAPTPARETAATAPVSMSSSEELIQRVQATSNAFRQYLELSKKPKEEILSALEGAGYTADQAKAMLPDVQKAEGRFHGGGGRQYAKTITNIQEELLVALRDVADLSWGGTEMSMRENGDFMHFDCRNTTFGYAVYSKTAPRHR